MYCNEHVIQFCFNHMLMIFANPNYHNVISNVGPILLVELPFRTSPSAANISFPVDILIV